MNFAFFSPAGLNFGTSLSTALNCTGYFSSSNEGMSLDISNVGALLIQDASPPITFTPPEPLPSDSEPMLLELVPSILSVSNSLSSIQPLFSDTFLSELGLNCGFLSTPASFISLIASAAASFTSLEPSPVIISA